MKKIILIIICIPFLSLGQTLDNYNVEYIKKIYLDIENNNFKNDSVADVELNKILSIVGNPNRFVVKSNDNVQNALATSYRGIRYILFNKEFISQITNRSNNYWANTFVLAHEVGHHLNRHFLVSNEKKIITLEIKRQQELEADEFAGFILSKLGANLSQTTEAINLLTDDEDDTASDHPTKTKRLKAIEIGFNNAISNNSSNYIQKKSELTYEDYFYNAVNKYKKKDFQGAINDYTNAIELNPNSYFYYNRACVKSDILDYKGAINDYTNAISLEPASFFYYNRGVVKYKINDFKGALLDYNKAIELNENYGIAFYNRGLSKYLLQDFHGAILDFTQAISLKINLADSYYNRGSVKDDLEDFKGAIADFSKTIEIAPEYSKAYINRGNSKNSISDFKGAIIDLTKGLLLNPKSKVGYGNRGIANYNLKKYSESIKDFDAAIAIEPNDSNSYLYRGSAKLVLKKPQEACLDWKIAKNLGDKNAIELIIKFCK